jgi:pimeloyl-ACP methyl ester carboxylesterase
VRRIYLVGLSNGAKGASVLAPRFRRQLSGLVLISGLSGRARPSGVPTLLVHGRRDPAVSEARAQRYLRRARGRATVTRVAMAGDHYVLLTRERRVRAAIGRWLGLQERRFSPQ